MKIIKIPKYFYHMTLGQVIEQQKNLLKEKPSYLKEEVIFDFSINKHTSVLALLYIAQLSDFIYKEREYNCLVRTKKESNQSWFTNIMGLTQSDKPDELLEKYLNEIRVAIQRCYNDGESLKAINKLIPIVKRELDLSESLSKALNWALWELVGNAGLHGYNMYNKQGQSYPKPVYFCAFDYKEFIDLAILDVGRGILKSFLDSGKNKYKNITNSEALSLSIKEEESCDSQGSVGFGLFGCSEIARKSGGQLVIISEDSKLIVSEKEKKILQSSHFNGTMVLLSIPQKATINLADILGEESIVISESIDDLTGNVNE